jgi:leucine-rich repeat-containing protein 49
MPPSSLTVYNEHAQISDEQVAAACAEFQGLSDIVLSSLPDALLQPLLGRLHVEGSRFMSQQQQEPVNAKQWLWSADPALRSVVAKEALQWHRGMLSQVNRRKDTVLECNAIQ